MYIQLHKKDAGWKEMGMKILFFQNSHTNTIAFKDWKLILCWCFHGTKLIWQKHVEKFDFI